MGFSVLGLALSLAVFAPNLLLLWFPPRPAIDDDDAPLIVEILERAGQALCVTLPAITVGAFVLWWAVVPVILCVAGYWALWVRFLASGRRRASLFAPALGIPVPMAVLPVAAFLAGAAWLGNPWIALAAVVLAAGHVPRSLIAAGSQ
ncbi:MULTISPECIES: hypothetical protein [unclassified Microbacterium]|uniref:hypothetical protein n=1 Tax=unclassified Microbacterium TaxID=2609290 RepID=UPI001605446F|nr:MULTISPECIES: hypothetical protein [unclassified Microbacterium]QNA92754.1 hypothetical protein G4G29_10935 [Microbacterium sp. Se63.02b]QYM62897.1 hypothetical protein K1X59_10975 [Microbacterium sp. Se5.02b]